MVMEEEVSVSPDLGSKSDHDTYYLSQKEKKGEPAAAHAYVKMEEEPSQARAQEVQSDSELCREPQCHFEFRFLKTPFLDELGGLASAVHAFRCRFDELQEHLHFIHNAIEARSKRQLPSFSLYANTGREILRNPNSNTIANYGGGTVQSVSLDCKSNKNGGSINSVFSRSELENLCETMCSRSLRKYIVSHLSDLDDLRCRVPQALKCAPNPAKLVFESIGRFFLQGRKAFTRDSPMVPARHAAVLILEFFLLSGAAQTGTKSETDNNKIKFEPSLKADANLAAIAWRKRLVNEGGLYPASDIDTRGLLLFVASFGIPTVFTDDDLRDLIRNSSLKKISAALRHSYFFLKRIPDIIEGMVKNDMNVEAVDVAFTFGVEDEFPPHTILSSYLRKCNEAWSRTKRETHGSPVLLKEANEKQLASLKSVLKCLDDHSIDASKILPGWQIKEQLINLEKDIADLDKKIKDKVMTKRKMVESESLSKYKSGEGKRPLFAAKGSPLLATTVIGFREQRTTSHLDGKSSYHSSKSANFSDGRFLSHANSYQATLSVPYAGSSLESLRENVCGAVLVGRGDLQATGVAAGGISTGIDGLSTGSFSELQRKRLQMSNKNSPPHEWYGIRNGVYNEKSNGQGISVQTTTSIGIDGSYVPSLSVEGFLGVPNPTSMISVSQRTKTSDLYQFADSVLDGDSNQSSNSKPSSLRHLLPAHHSAYL